jgi:DMSO/TMAO reductase YedYZ molybdopterin-dependent catalytic subunit
VRIDDDGPFDPRRDKPPTKTDARSAEARRRLEERRRFILTATAGTAVAAFGGWFVLSDNSLTSAARAQVRPDGRPRLPPGQRVIERLRAMGGREGDPAPRNFTLTISGAVDNPFTIDFRELVGLPGVRTQASDVHCVTAWSVMGARFTGVGVRELAERAKVRPGARHVIFEAAHGYTANVRTDEGLAPNAMVVWELDGEPLGRAHGAPVRALVPDLYFWKSAKWLTGIRFSERDEPGFWEIRGYNNHADPWKEERYS